MTNSETMIHPIKHQQSYTINCQGTLIDLSTPIVMGILNVTTDSFYDGGTFVDEKSIGNQVGKMLDEGATIIDVGAASSRPGSDIVPEDIEIERIKKSTGWIKKQFPETVISIDTWRSSVAQTGLDEGASIINDISGGDLDPKMFDTIAKFKVPYVIMHMQGIPQNMQINPTYGNVVQEVLLNLQNKVKQLRVLGINDVIVDPGFGFGKNLEHNYALLQQLSLLQMLDCPVLVGLSRKSMVNKILGTKANEALNGTTVLNTIALLNGANVLRVHDVKEAVEAIKIVQQFNAVSQ
jgi:dihydropteroate synthase